MPFWRKDSEQEAEQKALIARQAADQLESISLLRQGLLPVAATRRLAEQGAAGGSFFSSTLSPKAYLLAREAGYQPLGPVMGAAFMPVGIEHYEGMLGRSNGEVSSLTLARDSAQAIAVDRLRQEAKLLGADGVIGVRVEWSEYGWSQGFSQLTATGTAIKVPPNEMLAQAKHLPFTSSLSGQEFWQLFEGGYWPCGLLMSNCSYFVYSVWSNTMSVSSMAFSGNQNQEMRNITEGLNYARNKAIERLKHDIGSTGADGIVDMSVDYKFHPIRDESMSVLVDFTVMGTAVVRRPEGKARIRHQPLFIIDLASGSKRELEYEGVKD